MRIKTIDGRFPPPDWSEVLAEMAFYEVGETAARVDPSKERYKHMLHLVAYDIRDPRRLRKVAKTCEDFGLRVEYSVFECDLKEEVFIRFWNALLDIIEEEDSVIAYRICGACVSRIESIGAVIRPGKPLLYML